MTNEEKILSILDAIQTDMADLKTGVTGLKADVADIHDRLLRVELTQENQVLPQIEAWRKASRPSWKPWPPRAAWSLWRMKWRL